MPKRVSNLGKKKKSKRMKASKGSEKHSKALLVSSEVKRTGQGPVNTGQMTTIKNPPQLNKAFYKKAYQGK